MTHLGRKESDLERGKSTDITGHQQGGTTSQQFPAPGPNCPPRLYTWALFLWHLQKTLE